MCLVICVGSTCLYRGRIVNIYGYFCEGLGFNRVRSYLVEGVTVHDWLLV